MIISDFLGHETVRERLTRQLKEQTVPEAFLFYGPQGVGKTTLAKAFGYAVVMGQDTLSPHGKEHPDLTMIDLEGEAHHHTIQRIRQIKEQVYIPPLCGKKRVILIKQADKMLSAASHALLKCLEEPSPSTVFILLAPSLLDVLPTVASRCCKIAFHPLKTKEIEGFLVNEKNLSIEEASMVAKASLGSLSEALIASSPDDRKWKKAVLDLLVFYPKLTFLEFQDYISILEQQESQEKEFIQRFLDYMTLILIDMASVKHQILLESMTFPSYLETYRESSQLLKISFDGIQNSIEQLQRSYFLHVKIRSALEVLLLRLYS